MKIINGKEIANEILAELKQEIKEKNIKPCLAVVLVGNDPASEMYVDIKEGIAKEIGIEFRKITIPEQTSEEEIIKTVKICDQDKKIHGIIVQMPLPKRISSDKVIQVISPNKDVDGFVKGSHFKSPFIKAILRALDETGEQLENKKIIALVNSDIFGKALQKEIKAEYLIGFCDEFIDDLIQADIIICVLGQPNIIKGNMIKHGTVLIDGGISKINGKIKGDFDFESVKDKAKWITPIPGGLGPITVAFLLKNVVLAQVRLNL